MTAGMEAVLAVLAGAAELSAPITLTAGTWACPRCQRISRVVLTDDPDGWLPDTTNCPCQEEP